MTNKEQKIKEVAEQALRERIAELEAMPPEPGTQARLDAVRKLLALITTKAS